MKHVVTLREAPHKRAICETKMRYDVLLNGEQVGELHYNMTGYRGVLPLAGGRRLDIGERGISVFRAEIRRINKEAQTSMPADDPAVAGTTMP
jgi:hypothetical protein